MNITLLCCFHACLELIKNDYLLDPNTWKVSDFLGSINFLPPGNSKIITHTGDPAYWFDWKETVSEILAKNATTNDSDSPVTLEQGLKAISIFIENKYWINNKEILLRNAYNDLVQEFNNCKDNLEVSPLWLEWFAAINEAKKFKKTFVEKTR